MGIFFLICIMFLIGLGVYAIKTIANQTKNDIAEISNQKTQKEYRRKCQVCGTVFCFTDADLEKNKANQTIAALNSMKSFKNSITGSSYHMYEQKKVADSALSKIVHFDKCPKCNSSDLIDITHENEDKKCEFSDSIEQLKKFKELLDAGIISEEEFNEQKNKVLNK